MGRKVSIVLFWTLVVVSALALSRTTWRDWRGSLRIAAFVVPFVLFTSWFPSRFVGPKRRVAKILIWSVLVAMVSGAMALWDWTLFRRGFATGSSRVEGLVAGALFVASGVVFILALSRLLRRSRELPA